MRLLMDRDSTIAAIATAPGASAIAVIRLSGSRAVQIADSVFRGRRPLALAKPNTVHVGVVTGPDGLAIDTVLATVFRSPHSYTGEDLVELSTHGGLLIPRGVLRNLILAGARQAEPGEFTFRAFLNGKLDLCQAEAVAMMISSRSEYAARIARKQLEGKLSLHIGRLRKALVDVCALLELQLDFADEGLELTPSTEIIRRIAQVRSEIAALIESYDKGQVARDGVRVAIVGRPNVGKSSVFNRLLGESRAIVTAIPGTTRDTVEGEIELDGVLFRLIDTAGDRETTDPVELEGISRAATAVETANIVLRVTDVGQGWPSPASKREIVVVNKRDLYPPTAPGDGSEDGTVFISAKSGMGIDHLRAALIQKATAGADLSGMEYQIASNRQRSCLANADQSLSAAVDLLDNDSPYEIVSIEVREATSSLASITGEITADDVLNGVFSTFCVGK